jgi:tetratricopeptide (TPR) repeat protein
MTSRLRRLLLVGALLLVAAFACSLYLEREAPAPKIAAVRPAIAQPRRPAFSEPQLQQFLDEAHKAEAIADPLQRCLSYPNPPGVHWSDEVASAYCHFMLDTEVTSAEVRDLIERGKAAELQERLANAEKAQQSEPGAQSRLDRIYNQVFSDGSDDMRALMDAWKRQSPDNAFALAASGAVYLATAQAQRGDDFADKTPQTAFDAMHRLLGLARADLDRAVEIDPKLIPAYHTMIHIARMDSDPRYGTDAAKRALAVQPASFPIYSSLIGMAEPRWGGSVALMNRLIGQAQVHAPQNALLRLLLSQRDGAWELIENCACDDFADADLYRRFFAEVPMLGVLKAAGWAAEQRGHPALAVVYRSQLLRFYPADLGSREGRTFGLLQLERARWAIEEGNILVRMEPRDQNAYGLRGSAYRISGDPFHAAQDFEQALRLNPQDPDLLFSLGDVYANETHDWDRGWAMADQLMQANDPRAWLLRAQIQKTQPRTGLDQTVREFMQRFSADPALRPLAERMQSLTKPLPVPSPAPTLH